VPPAATPDGPEATAAARESASATHVEPVPAVEKPGSETTHTVKLAVRVVDGMTGIPSPSRRSISSSTTAPPRILKAGGAVHRVEGLEFPKNRFATMTDRPLYWRVPLRVTAPPDLIGGVTVPLEPPGPGSVVRVHLVLPYSLTDDGDRAGSASIIASSVEDDMEELVDEEPPRRTDSHLVVTVRRADGTPVRNTTVSVFGFWEGEVEWTGFEPVRWEFRARTDRNGHARLEELPIGPAHLEGLPVEHTAFLDGRDLVLAKLVYLRESHEREAPNTHVLHREMEDQRLPHRWPIRIDM